MGFNSGFKGLNYTSRTLAHSECGISRTAFGYVQRTDGGYTWMDI